MSLPAAWVDRLLMRLQVRYGEAWTRQVAGIDPEAVKADWSQVLAGLSLDALDYGVRHLPTDRPPNAMQFRAVCMRAPAEAPPALPAPVADPGRVQRLLAAASVPSEIRARLSDGAYAVYRIHTCDGTRQRGRMGQAQVEMVKAIAKKLRQSEVAELLALGVDLSRFRAA